MASPEIAPAVYVDRLLADMQQLLDGPLPAVYAQALLRVPRHLFLPERLWLRDAQGGYRPCALATDPEGWMEAAYSDAPLVTQFADGRPSSSASMPSMVMRMLLLADLGATRGPGHVLELGTGTGFNAGLLCALLGEQAVTTLELDPVLAAQGERNLKAAGYAPTIVRTDAAAGWATGAPYDRIVATFSTDRVPAPWVAQTRPGGRIVTPWTSAWCCYGTLALGVAPDGTAEGRFHPFASYMPMRRTLSAPGADTAAPETATTVTGTAALAAAAAGEARPTTTDLSPWAVAGGDLDAEFHLGLTVPGASFAWDTTGAHAHTRLHLEDATSPSWATVDYDGQHADEFTVTQVGPRHLWDEISAAYRQWEILGRPVVGQYGLTVRDQEHTVWLSTPGRTLSKL
ncbi:methyltransferase [Streptomyces flavidovirens]|uniref:Protein-L-isoaspartate O-methyltransferase n=1 Tax=Streptomyces flavidovirens TaxID=67298 RepID=A0ABW6RNV9_9ACTN